MNLFETVNMHFPYLPSLFVCSFCVFFSFFFSSIFRLYKYRNLETLPIITRDQYIKTCVTSPSFFAACNLPLGMEDWRIADGQITASTYTDFRYVPSNARLNRAGDSTTSFSSWSSAFRDAYQWIQVDLGFVMMVSGIVLQGRVEYVQYVTKYKVRYISDDDSSWRWVKDSSGQDDMVRLK